MSAVISYLVLIGGAAAVALTLYFGLKTAKII